MFSCKLCRGNTELNWCKSRCVCISAIINKKLQNCCVPFEMMHFNNSQCTSAQCSTWLIWHMHVTFQYDKYAMTHLQLIRSYLTFMTFIQMRFHNNCYPAWLKMSCRSLLVTLGTEFTWNSSSFSHVTLYHSLSWLIALFCNSSVCSF